MDSAFSELWCTIDDGKFNWNLGSQYSQYRLEKLGKEIKSSSQTFWAPFPEAFSQVLRSLKTHKLKIHVENQVSYNLLKVHVMFRETRIAIAERTWNELFLWHFLCAFSLAALRLYKELSPATDCGRAFEFGERNILTEVLAKESKPKP